MVDPRSRKGQSQARLLHRTNALSHDCSKVTAWSGGGYGKGDTDELSKLEYVLAVLVIALQGAILLLGLLYFLLEFLVFLESLGGRRE